MQSEPVLYFFEVYEDDNGKCFVRSRITKKKGLLKFYKVAYWVIILLLIGLKIIKDHPSYELTDWFLLISIFGVTGWIYDLIFNKVMYGYGSLDLTEKNFPARIIFGSISLILFTAWLLRW